MNDEIGLDDDIEPTADASEGVKGGKKLFTPPVSKVEDTTTGLGGPTLGAESKIV